MCFYDQLKTSSKNKCCHRLNNNIPMASSEMLTQRQKEEQRKESNTGCSFLSVFVCPNMCGLCSHQTNRRDTNTDRMTDQDVERKSSFCSCAVASGAPGGSEPARPLLLHMTPVCMADLAWGPRTRPPQPPCIWPPCHPETRPRQRKSTACMNNELDLDAAAPALRSPGCDTVWRGSSQHYAWELENGIDGL